ncbi:MAG: hypothetical protein UT48_C0039G0006 [Parcubacteria group bacterium GW2011_GWE2_39_37]|uniref:Histidine kinase/HSP90-like ATPase domain-containing protein n=1 Tax=Candidatus Falkowbacteria bacterium GW2011_GWF2_39_8 TaxID=1618642 RepID=A0A0G0SBQ1_9BACT|nr:MAG: hypothetical protein UT48_C0039G0006 [Parcubacteria group bacterium GW2011_GWE2_39_37]KKR32145.1 MAG: hypothetical protein UT64_C0041G0009 [Candidatus Falkowbacteria bacterium GW2011_GWF2_39_8]
METERHFSQLIEKKESTPKTYTIKFDSRSFGDKKIDSLVVKYWKQFGDPWLPGAVSEWWEKICLDNKLDPTSENLRELELHLIEIARNAFEEVGNGEIKLIFEPHKITAVVTDQGPGFESPPNELMWSMHGLDLVKKYADEFSIETNGIRYSKESSDSDLIESGEADIKTGSKITFIKNFE